METIARACEAEVLWNCADRHRALAGEEPLPCFFCGPGETEPTEPSGWRLVLWSCDRARADPVLDPLFGMADQARSRAMPWQ